MTEMQRRLIEKFRSENALWAIYLRMKYQHN